MKTLVTVILSGLAATLLMPACARASASEVEAVGSTKTQGASMEPAHREANAKVVAEPRTHAARELERSACPTGMVLVEGDYCPEVEQVCLEWMDPPSSRYHEFRCRRYAQPAKCKKPREHRRYCIDATERREPESALPRHHMSWTTSKRLCEESGARLCRESEWIFACEGEEMRPYPYGWERDSSACNVDRSENIGKVGRLVDHRAPVASNPRCASPFGVQDMAGNVEEWTQADGPGKGSKMGWKEVLKGSWWIPSRHACRQYQVGHDDVYQGAETGTRCCRDAL